MTRNRNQVSHFGIGTILLWTIVLICGAAALIFVMLGGPLAMAGARPPRGRG